MARRAKFDKLLNENLQPGERLRVAYSSLARISLDGRLVLKRDASSVDRRRPVYAPIGGAVSVPIGELNRLTRTIGQNFEIEKIAARNGEIGVRFWLSRRHTYDVVDWIKTLAPIYTSPAREIRSELVERRSVIPTQDMGRMVMKHAGFAATLRRRCYTDGSDLTLAIDNIWDYEPGWRVQKGIQRAADINDDPAFILALPAHLPTMIKRGRITEDCMVLERYLPAIVLPGELSTF